mmetsp:Transcript_30679/g.36007  ORF Transcript_30679/g.36007 Transcript_30679/m.36007 type:complete len:125 (+) Transcript_30679:244-618(+)
MGIGLLHSVDKRFAVKKAEELYNLVHAQEFISASDHDWVRIGNKIFTLATTIAINGSEQTKPYKSEELTRIGRSMVEDEGGAFATVFGLDEQEESLLSDIFGFDSKVHNEVFVEKVTQTAYWIF